LTAGIADDHAELRNSPNVILRGVLELKLAFDP
jgi:hypothetical protein